MTETYDVVVVGAGPAGSTTAYLLAGMGHRVVLLDRQHFPRPKACAEYMSPGVRDALSRLGLSSVLAGAQSIPGMEIISGSPERLRIGYNAGQTRLLAVALQRNVLDWRLVESAVAAGAELREGVVAREPVMTGSTVTGVRVSVDGRSLEIGARLTIVADGARSTLAAKLGLSRPPRWPKRIGLVGHVAGASMPGGWGRMFVESDGYCGVAPLPEGHANVAMVMPIEQMKRTGLSAQGFFLQWIETHSSLRDCLAGTSLEGPVRGVAPIGARVHRPWAPGALLVGDAAGFFDPFTGEGIYRALRGAEMAAVAAHAALTGADVLIPLQKYEWARTQAFRRKSEVTALVQLFVRYPGLLRYATPRLNSRPAALETLSNVLGDTLNADAFLRPSMLWKTLRP